MQDVLLVAIMVAFFALCLLFVRACEAIIGSEDELEPSAADGSAYPNERAA
jgi:hypothetical protein